MNTNKTHWNIPVSRVLDDALEQALRHDTHSTKADFVRDCVRQRLEQMGFQVKGSFEVEATA